MGRKQARKYQAAYAALDAIYAQLPTVQCQGQCAVGCGPVPLTDLEGQRLQAATHQKPRTIPLTPDFALVGQPTPRERCVYLTPAARCAAYAVRPLLCRVWGTVKMLSCMHGCLPDRWLTEREFVALAAAVER